MIDVTLFKVKVYLIFFTITALIHVKFILD